MNYSGMKNASRGQLLSSEIILALCLFLGSLIAFVLAWNAASASFVQAQQRQQAQAALVGIADMAVLSPGDPADWETRLPAGANAYGFASSPGVLSARKLSALQSLNPSYDSMREGMGAGRFELYLAAHYPDGAALYSFGRAAAENDTLSGAVSIERLALLDGSPVILKVQLWKKTG